jgi:3-isopropylmalate dehydrogenase
LSAPDGGSRKIAVLSDMDRRQRIAVIPGDGIGIEVTDAAVHVLEAAAGAEGVALALDHFDLGAERYLRDGTTLPEDTFAALRDDYGAVLFGALGDPRIPDMAHARDILLGLRFRLDLYVNHRPIELLDERHCPLKGKRVRDVQMVVFRENTEGLYVGVGGIFKKGTPDEIAVNESINTYKGVERIVRHAFEFARRQRRRRRVTMADKSNVLRYAHDLWQRVFARLREEYADVESEHMFIDTLCMEMVHAPERFDVIVTCNLFGDIITDLGAQLAGGIGLAASGNVHPGRIGVFEPVHGSAPDIAGKDRANPLAAVRSAAMMMRELGHDAVGARLDAAVRAAIRENRVTPDLGGTTGTRACAAWLAERARQDP